MKVRLRDGSTLACQDTPMDQGAMGEVYRSKDGQTLVKLYKKDKVDVPDQRDRLEKVVGPYDLTQRDPEWNQILCWPQEIVESPQLGVTMPFIEDRLAIGWVTGPKANQTLDPEQRRWGSRLRIALRLAMGVSRLHGDGLVHGDLSKNNVLVDPETGDATIIDLDGLVVENYYPPDVLGTHRYMAPETISDGKRPNRETDQHALAVLLFQLLLIHHPLEGPKIYSEDPDLDEQLRYGPDAVYIAHPTDTSNRPESLIHPRTLGRELEHLFQQAFTEGLKNPAKRPLASQWEQALWRLTDRVLVCDDGQCKLRHYPVAAQLGSIRCPWCSTVPSLKHRLPLLRFYRRSSGGDEWFSEHDQYIVGARGRTLHPWHTRYGTVPSLGNTDPVAEIRCEGGDWSIKNQELKGMREVGNDGTEPVSPGDEVALEDGKRLLLHDGPNARMVYVQMVGSRPG